MVEIMGIEPNTISLQVKFANPWKTCTPLKMVGIVRLELTIFSISARCFNLLSYIPINGGNEGFWALDPRIFSPMLLPSELHCQKKSLYVIHKEIINILILYCMTKTLFLKKAQLTIILIIFMYCIVFITKIKLI